MSSRFAPSKNVKELSDDKVFQRAHNYVLKDLKELRRASESFLFGKFPVVARVYAAHQLAEKALESCKKCPNVIENVEPETCMVIEILRELKQFLLPGPGKDQRG